MMNNNINLHRINTNILSNTQTINRTKQEGKKDFQDIFSNIQKEKEVIKFSKHAKERMDSRNITLNNREIEKIETAIGKAEKKGIKEALILMDNKAFIANVKNKTIITTVAQEQLKDNAFTNIDGAVIV